jgi:subtilase family serine protease
MPCLNAPQSQSFKQPSFVVPRHSTTQIEKGGMSMPRKAGLVLALSSVVALLLVCGVPAYAQSSAASLSMISQKIDETTADNGFSAIPGSIKPATDLDVGEFSSPRMAVDVVLAPNHESELSDLLANVYNPKSNSYQHWLGKGEFYSRFAPSDAQIAPIADYLRASGLAVERSSSPFLVRASGPSSTVAAAFRTTLRSYRNPKGIEYFSNASEIQLPTSLASGVVGVVGLSNTVRLQSQVVLPLKHTSPPVPSCEAPYPTTAQLFAAVNFGTPFPFGYGGGPGCNGLTPSQDNSIYGAPHLGPRGKGAGVNLAVFELSAYQHSDIATWAQTFYGASYTPPLVDITVDGGPLSPVCPAGDTCPPDFNGYA